MKGTNFCKIAFCFFLISALFLSCSKSKVQERNVFNIDSLVETQATYLSKVKAKIIKHSILNAKSETQTVIPGNPINWERELEIFDQLNLINKPINRDFYTVDVTSDSKSNLKIMQFSTQRELPIKFLKVYYKNAFTEIKKIEALYKEQNYLNQTMISLEMEFDKIYNIVTLTNYHIHGNQKMILGDTVSFDIKGEVHLNRKVEIWRRETMNR